MQSSNMTCVFFKNAHKAHGLYFYWEAEETYEGRKLSLKSSALLFHANVIWQHGAGKFFPALMCPLRDSSVQRSSHLKAPLFSVITKDFYINSVAFLY